MEILPDCKIGAGVFFTLTVVYTPKGFLLHTASLRQTFVHCAIFVTAAPRGGLGSVSVPMWRINLSVPLRVDALVSRYLTNKLIRHRPLPYRPKPLISLPFDIEISSGITCTFANPPEGEAAIPKYGVRYLCITHPFATNLPEGKFVRLACLSHAVSVRSEPGSNSSIFYRLPVNSIAKVTQGHRIDRLHSIRLYTHVCSRECSVQALS